MARKTLGASTAVWLAARSPSPQSPDSPREEDGAGQTAAHFPGCTPTFPQARSIPNRERLRTSGESGGLLCRWRVVTTGGQYRKRCADSEGSGACDATRQPNRKSRVAETCAQPCRVCGKPEILVGYSRSEGAKRGSNVGSPYSYRTGDAPIFAVRRIYRGYKSRYPGGL
jgi:hypothetical protein